MHLAELARERKANIEARGYLKSAMSLALDRPEPYYGLGFLWENEGDERRAVQYYYMAITADHSYRSRDGRVEAARQAAMIQRSALVFFSLAPKRRTIDAENRRRVLQGRRAADNAQ